MMRRITIGLAAVTIATASLTLTASALPGGGTSVSRNPSMTALPQSALAEAALASVAVSDLALASVVALPSIVDLDSGPAPLPSTAVSDAGLASVDLVDGRSTPTRPPACPQR